MAATVIPIPELQIETLKAPEQTAVRCAGKITSSSLGLLQAAVRAAIPEAKCVVLDLTDVTYLDSSGLGAIVSLYVSARRQHCELKLIHLNQRLKELFSLTRLATIFEGHEDYLGVTPD